MKYKVGDKFIVEVEEADERKAIPYKLKLSEGKVDVWVAEEHLIDQLQQTACSGEEAWETAKQILFEKEFTHDVLNEIFGTMNHYAIMRDLKPDEVKAKIDEWKKQKDEIKVGDILKHKSSGNLLVVTRRASNGYCDVLDENGCTAGVDRSGIERDFEKTGEHIKIEKVFSKIKGE